MLVLLQVEVLLQRRQSCVVHGHLCSWLPGQHTTSAVWGIVGAAVLVLHGAHSVGSVPRYGNSGLCLIIPFHLQDLCLCEGRLNGCQIYYA